jgi:hypothetical protein
LKRESVKEIGICVRDALIILKGKVWNDEIQAAMYKHFEEIGTGSKVKTF